MKRISVAEFILRAEKQLGDPPPPDKDYTWQKRMEDSNRNKAQPNSQKNKPGLFTQSPSKIANDLKMQNPTDYGKASRKLNNQINRQGRNMDAERKHHLYDAKDALKNAYGEQNKSKGDTTKTTSTVETPIYNTPMGHNLDDPTWNLSGVVPDMREKIIQDALPLGAGIQNTTQNPNTRMSSLETEGGSTSKNNLDETHVAPKTIDWSIADPNPIDQAGAQLEAALKVFK